MAKSWIIDNFAGRAAELFGRKVETGQRWGVSIPNDFERGWLERDWRVKDGKAFFLITDPAYGRKNQACGILIEPTILALEKKTVTEWWLNRFPSQTTIPSMDTEAHLLFSSQGNTPGVGLQLNGIRVSRGRGSDNNKVFVSTPISTSPYTMLYRMNENVTWYDVLPPMTSPSHPAEYYFKLTVDDGVAKLELNGNTVYNGVPAFPEGITAVYRNYPAIGPCPGIGIRYGMSEGFTPYEGHISTGNVVAFKRIRFQYQEVPLDQLAKPVHQIARMDGLNGTGAYQLNSLGRGIRGGAIWQISGQD